MEKVSVLYNPYSGNNNGYKFSKRLENIYGKNLLTYYDMTKIKDFNKFLKEVDEDIIICGGDGTLNYFINHTDEENYIHKIFYYPCGSGNDFHNDVDMKTYNRPYEITKYLKNLPIVKVKGKEYKFLNNVGFGIDGYCCEEGDKVRKKTTKPVNYTKIALKGLVKDFKPVNATVTIDGKEKEYAHVWLAPTMNGRYYGGGMKAAPNQDRLNENNDVSVAVMHVKNKVKALIAFPSIFKGKHIKKTKIVEINKGHEIEVKFDKATALQIDGETIPNVREYKVMAKKRNK